MQDKSSTKQDILRHFWTFRTLWILQAKIKEYTRDLLHSPDNSIHFGISNTLVLN